MTSPISRRFHGRRREVDAARVPPGQYVTGDFPVLSAGPSPTHPARSVELPSRWGGRPADVVVTVDIHCVTSWSKLGTNWRGVGRHALRRPRHRAPVRDGPQRTAATRPTCRSTTCSAARPGSCTPSRGRRSRASTAARLACSCRTSTSGRAPSGCRASRRWRPTGPASGRTTATTTTATPGSSIVTRGTDVEGRASAGAVPRRSTRPPRRSSRHLIAQVLTPVGSANRD